MFLSVTVCKGSRLLSLGESSDTKFAHLDENMVKSEKHQNLSMKDQICSHYSLMLYAGAVLFFSYLGNKLLGKYKERGEKMKAIKKLKKE